MLKIMIQANAPWVKTGYGQACYLLLEIFKKLQHEVAIFAYYGAAEGNVMDWKGTQIYPRGHDEYGNDIVDAHMTRFGGDLLISMVDVHVLRQYGRRGFHWVPIVPVDGDPLSRGIADSIPGAVAVVSMSQYGHDVLTRAGFNSDMIYLPVDTNTFYPIDKAKARATYGWPEDAYIVGHIGMNRGIRKGHDLLLQAFQYFLAEVPDALLYLHTDTLQPDGLNLNSLIENLGLKNSVIMPRRYDVFIGQSTYYMLGVYNALDLYVQPSLNEGQGMPLWEAAAVGLPIVATAGTALREVMEGAEAIAVEPVNRVWNPSGTFGYEVSVDQLAQSMLDAYRKWGNQYVSLVNRERAVECVSPSVVAMQWQDTLLKVEKRIRFTPQIRPWQDKPNIVHVSTIRKNCGIALYTQALMASLSDATDQQIVDILTLESADQIPDCDLLHIHYESSISPQEQTLREVLHVVRQRGTKIVCTFHTIVPDVVNAMLTERLIDMGIIHWPHAQMEISPDVIAVLGGMGVPSYNPPSGNAGNDRGRMRMERGIPESSTLISTFGFASVGRGHYEVLQEIAPYMVYMKDVHVQLLLSENAFNPEGFQIVHEQIADIVDQFGLQGRVHVCSEFLSALEVLNRLWMSDIGFLYLDFDALSTSSAARYFVAARLPLVVSPSTHFADLRRGVVRSRPSLYDFGLSIMELVKDQKKRERLSRQHESTYRDFVWPRFAEKHLEIYRRVLGR